MFNRLRKNLPSRGGGGQQQQPKDTSTEDQKEDEPDTQAGFICPMCMAALPGPAELQVHFEKVHSEGGSDAEGKLIDIDTSEDQTDALPDQIQEDLAMSPSNDFSKSQLEMTLDSNAPDTEKEVVLLQQELSEISSQLKEEKWYSGQLKLELDKVSKERDKLEEDKQMVEEEFSSQLRSAEAGYLQVAQENEKLKQELTYADYKTTKDRHEKLQQEMQAYKNDAVEEKQRRMALEESFKLLQEDYNEEQMKSSKVEEQLQARPSSDVIDGLDKQVKDLQAEINSMKQKHQQELNEFKQNAKTKEVDFEKEKSSLNMTIKELKVERDSKEEHISSLQTAVSTSSEASSFSKQQLNDKQQQIIELQKNLSEQENNMKDKDNTVSTLEKEINSLKILSVNETSSKERLQDELNNTTSKLDEMTRLRESTENKLSEVENKLGQQKDEIVRLEKERIELIAKIEAGEGTDTVIQQLTQEKNKLLETMTSLEKSLADQMKQHQSELDVIRKDKGEITKELQQSKQDYEKVQLSCKEFEMKHEVAQESIANLKKDLKSKNDDYFQMESHHANEKTQLNEQISQLTKTNVEINVEFEKTKEKLTQALNDLNKSDKNQAQQASWIETKNNAIAEMTGKISSLQEQLNSKNNDLTALNQSMNERVDALTKEKGLLELNLEALNKDLREVKAQKVDAEKLIESIRVEKESLEKIEARLLEKQDELTKEVEDLRTTSKAQEEELRADKEKTVNELQASHTSALDGLKNELSEVKNQLDETKINLENTQLNLESEIVKRNKAEKNMMELEQKYARIESSLEQKDDVLRSVQEELEVAQKELKKPCESCKNYEIQLCRLQEATRDQSGQIERLNTKLEEVETNLKEKTTEHESKCKEFEKLTHNHEAKANELNGQLNKFKEDIVHHLEEIESLKSEIENLKQQINVSNDEKNQTKLLLSEETEKKQTLKTEKSELENEVLDLKAEVELNNESIQQLEDSLKEKDEALKQQSDENQKKIEDLQQKLHNETEVHQASKTTMASIQQTLKDESVALQNKLDAATKETMQVRRMKDESEKSHNEELQNIKNALKRQEQEIQNRDRRLNENELAIKTIEKERNDIKGELTVSQAKLENSKDENKLLMERLIESEEKETKAKQKYSETNRKLEQALGGLQELGQENQNIQVQQQMKSTRQWENDADISNCKKCDKSFSFSVRKHHCRNCGCIFCKDCSAWSAVLASSKKPVRVCEHCSMELNNVRGSSVRRLSTTSIQSTASSVASPYRP
eukprot:TCONS_00002873-protein